MEGPFGAIHKGAFDFIELAANINFNRSQRGQVDRSF